MSGLVDPFSVMPRLRPGSMAYGRVDVGDGWETAFLVREESREIRRLGDRPRLRFRAALMVESGVGLVPIIVRLGRSQQQEFLDEYYEAWFNVHQGEPGGGLVYLDDLIRQSRLSVILFCDRGRQRAIGAANLLGETFAEMKRQLAVLPAWSMQTFDAARERVYARLPTVEALWDHLESVGEGLR